MRVNINGTSVVLRRLEYDGEGAGHILQFLLEHKGTGTDIVLKTMEKVLKSRFDGVMSDFEPNDDGNVELRVLQGFEFPALLTLQAHGLHVDQIG